MKIRAGFVSNSSSSSFAIIGTENTDTIDALMRVLDLNVVDPNDDNYMEEDWYYNNSEYGIATEKEWLFAGSDTVYYAGIDASKILQDMSIPQAVEVVKQRLINLKVNPGTIKFLYGEASSE